MNFLPYLGGAVTLVLCLFLNSVLVLNAQKMTRSELERLVYANDETVIEDRLRNSQLPDFSIYPPDEGSPSMPTMDPPLFHGNPDEVSSSGPRTTRRRRLRNKNLMSDLMKNLRMLRQTPNGPRNPRTRQSRTFSESPPVRSPYLKSRVSRPSTLITSTPDELQVAFKRIEIMASRSGLKLSELPRRSQLQVVKKLMTKLDPRKREMVRESLDSPNNLEKVFSMLPEPARDPLLEDDPEYLAKFLGGDSSREHTYSTSYTQYGHHGGHGVGYPSSHDDDDEPHYYGGGSSSGGNSNGNGHRNTETHTIVVHETPDTIPSASSYGSEQSFGAYQEQAHKISITSSTPADTNSESSSSYDNHPTSVVENPSEYGDIKTLDRLPSLDVYKQDEHNNFGRELKDLKSEQSSNSQQQEEENSFDAIRAAPLIGEYHESETQAGSFSEPFPVVITAPKSKSHTPQTNYPRNKAINFMTVPSTANPNGNSTNIKTSFSVSSSVSANTSKRPEIRVSIISKDAINIPSTSSDQNKDKSGSNKDDLLRNSEYSHSAIDNHKQINRPSASASVESSHDKKFVQVFQLEPEIQQNKLPTFNRLPSTTSTSTTESPYKTSTSKSKPEQNSFNSFDDDLDDDYNIEESILIDYLISRNKNKTAGKTAAAASTPRDPFDDIDYLNGDSEEIIKNMMDAIDSGKVSSQGKGAIKKDQHQHNKDDILHLNPHPLEYPDHPDHPEQFGQYQDKKPGQQHHQGHYQKHRPGATAPVGASMEQSEYHEDMLMTGVDGPGFSEHHQQGGPLHGKKRVRGRPNQQNMLPASQPTSMSELQNMLNAKAAALRWNRMRLKQQSTRVFPPQRPPPPFLRPSQQPPMLNGLRRNSRLRLQQLREQQAKIMQQQRALAAQGQKSNGDNLRINEVKVSELPTQFNRECDYFSEEICLLVQDYPIEAIEEAFSKNPSLKELLVKEPSIHASSYVEGVPKQKESNHYEDAGSQNHRNKDFAGEGGFLCPSKVAYGRIKKAKSASEEKNKWKFIVNYGEELSQTLRLEKCLSPGNVCSYVMPYYRTACTQVYNYHRLLAWDSEKGLHMDVFKIPVTCTCHVQGYYVPSANSPPKMGPPPPRGKHGHHGPPKMHHSHKIHHHPERFGQHPHGPPQHRRPMKPLPIDSHDSINDEMIEETLRIESNMNNKKENIQDLLVQYQNLRERIAKLNAAKKQKKDGEDSNATSTNPDTLSARSGLALLSLTSDSSDPLNRFIRRRSENSKKSSSSSKTSASGIGKKSSSTNSLPGTNMLLEKKSLSVKDWLRKMKYSLTPQNFQPQQPQGRSSSSSLVAPAGGQKQKQGQGRSGRKLKMFENSSKTSQRRSSTSKRQRRRPGQIFKDKMRSLSERLSSVFSSKRSKHQQNIRRQSQGPVRGMNVNLSTGGRRSGKKLSTKSNQRRNSKNLKLPQNQNQAKIEENSDDLEETLLLRRAIARLQNKIKSLDKPALSSLTNSTEKVLVVEDKPADKVDSKSPNPKELALEVTTESLSKSKDSPNNKENSEKDQKNDPEIEKKRQKLRQRLHRLRQRLAFRKGILPSKVNYSYHPIMDYYNNNNFAPRK